MKVFNTPIQVRFSDTDMLGHVNNSSYNQFFDIGRYEYLTKTFGDLNNWKERMLVVVHIETDYLKPVFIETNINVETQIAEVGNRSLKMRQQIVNDKGEIMVKSMSIMSAFDARTGQSFVIPDDWRERIK
ncbi:MAG: acyl-CoA thioesterase [Prevotellaceae bacterium]|jgi:acyl-CoA thioester hydrolase|nr:acyl-CoA thioesterase [Prevotellaceae bacterium]